VPREDAVREKAVRLWAALQDLDLARVSQPKMGRGYFLVDWNALKFVAGGPEGTLDELEQFLRGNVPQPPKPCPGGVEAVVRHRSRLREGDALTRRRTNAMYPPIWEERR
jgi:hypothetical protein